MPESAMRTPGANDTRNALQTEIADLNAALDEARRRQGIAKQAEAVEAEAQRARQAEPILKRLEARGAAMDQAIERYCAEFAGIGEDYDALLRLRCPVPSRDLIRVNLRNAHDAATMFLDKTSRPVPPLRRKRFADLLTGWCVPGLRWVSDKDNSAAKAA